MPEQAPTPPATKALLREQLQTQLRALDPAAAASAADRVAERVLALPEIERAQRILTCLSFGTEIDTWRLVDRLLAAGRELFVPRADSQTGRLHVHPYPCPLVTLPFGLQQPPPGTPEIAESAIDSTLDAALVLGLAFDRRGYRLGHGSGYFDRFLVHRPFPAVGLAYALQLRDELPVEPHDVPMAVVVTEAEVWRANARLVRARALRAGLAAGAFRADDIDGLKRAGRP